MTARRAEIASSLAERGRPEMWANEQESAVLSGYPADGVNFRRDLPDLEKAGFPMIDPLPGKRFVPAIVDFWRRRVDALPAEVPKLAANVDIRQYEDAPSDKSKRLAS